MISMLCYSLALISLPILIGFIRGFVEALHRPRPRLRLVIFHNDD
jgi:hypothetical protein